MNCLLGDTERLISDDLLLCTAPNPASVRNETNRRGSSVASTIFLLVNSTLGAGLLNFPQVFDQSGGLITSITTQLFFLVFITASLVILANCSDVTNTCSMQEMMAKFYGPKALILCGSCVAIYSFGCCLTFLIVIGDQFDRVLATYYGMDYCHTWYLSRTFVTVISCSLFILPLCFFKTLDVLSYASFVGCLIILYVVSLIVYKCIAQVEPPTNPMKIWPDNNYEALQIIPIICFAYQSHMTAIPLYACMKQRSLASFTFCSVLSMLICFATYTTVAVAGYASFGSGKVPSDILQGYNDKSVFLTIAIIFVAVKNFTTYPIVLFCGRDAIFSLLRRDPNLSPALRVFLTVSWFAVSLVMAVLVPDISPVINLLGSLSAAFIFIFPGVSLFRSVLLKDSQLYLNKDRLLIVFTIFLTALGTFAAAVVFVEAIEDLGKEKEDAKLVKGFRQLSQNLCA